MNIDFIKLITLLLPTFMRNGLISIIQAVASQFTSLYSDFQLWQIDIRLQAAMTCQVMYLETILNYRLLGSFIRTIYISDGDGVIVDFIVNVPAGLNIDNYRMIALIEKYKIAGKRYTIGQSAYIYEVQWSDFYCEKANREFIVQWTNPVCELTGRIIVDNFISFDRDDHNVTVVSELAITFDNPVGLEVGVYIRTAHTGGIENFVFIIPPGESTSATRYMDYSIIECYITSVSPLSDSYYNYIY